MPHVLQEHPLSLVGILLLINDAMYIRAFLRTPHTFCTFAITVSHQASAACVYLLSASKHGWRDVLHRGGSIHASSRLRRARRQSGWRLRLRCRSPHDDRPPHEPLCARRSWWRLRSLRSWRHANNRGGCVAVPPTGRRLVRHVDQLIHRLRPDLDHERRRHVLGFKKGN